MSRLHWFGLRIWFCTLQLAEKASCTDPAVIPGCIEQVRCTHVQAVCTNPAYRSHLYQAGLVQPSVQNSGVGLHVKRRRRRRACGMRASMRALHSQPSDGPFNTSEGTESILLMC